MSSHLASPVAAKLHSFLGDLSQRSVSDLPELRRDVRAFIDDTLSDSSTVEHHHTRRQHVEEFLLDALHPIYYYTLSSDKTRNNDFNRKCRSLQWIVGYHLELADSFNPSLYINASVELAAMSQCKPPESKLGCLLKAWHFISSTLEDERKEPVGADEVFPVFVWVLLHSGSTTFVHDLSWIRFGTGLSGEVDGECEYWLTMAECALYFIERMHQGMIREKEPGEWDRRVAEAGADGAEAGRADQRDGINMLDVFTLLV